MTPQVSIIVLSSDHWKLSEVAEHLLRQSVDMSMHELIVVDCIGTRAIRAEIDAAESLFRGAMPVRAFSLGSVPRSKARNAAIAVSSHALLLFFGDDILPGPTTVERHIRFHQSHAEENKVAIGPCVFPERLRDDPFRRWLDDSGVQFGVPFTRGPDAVSRDFFYVTNTSIKRAFQDRAGPYDERFPYHMTDDYAMGIRMNQIGMDMEYLPEAICFHDHRVTIRERMEMMKQAAHSARIYESLFPERGPLYRQYNLSCRRYRWHAALGKFLNWLVDSEQARNMYYGSVLAAAFLQEYQRLGSLDRTLKTSSNPT